MRRVDWSEVTRRATGPLTPGRAAALVGFLRGLARFWLNDQVLAAYNAEYPQAGISLTAPPRLPDAPGSCWVAFALESPRATPLLRPALLLPLCWARGEPHGPGLPPRLREVADGVTRSTGLSTWGLRLTPAGGIDTLDLSSLEFDADSAWAPLAGGLLVAADGGRPRPEVWATGCWARYGGVTPVGGLPAKRDLARSWGARLFFVPPGQCDSDADDPALRPLGASSTSPREALSEYLSALDAPPAETAPFHERANYYLRQPAESAAAAEYYRRRLLPEVADRLASSLRRDTPACKPTTLVTIVSGSPELVLLAADALLPERCLLLHTEAFEVLAEETARLLRERGRTALPTAFDAGVGLRDSLDRKVRGFLAGVAPDAVVFDLTPGTKQMTLALDALARKHWPGAWLWYLRHEMRGRRAVPGRETPVVCRAE